MSLWLIVTGKSQFEANIIPQRLFMASMTNKLPQNITWYGITEWGQCTLNLSLTFNSLFFQSCDPL